MISHFDSDHIKGLSQIIELAPDATCVTAPAMVAKDFLKLVGAITGDKTRLGRTGLDEIRSVLEILKGRNQVPAYAGLRKTIFAEGFFTFSHGAAFELTTLSPADVEMQRFLEWVATQFPKQGQGKGRLRKSNRNDLSVVVSIRVGDDILLLGADLLEHGDISSGWSAILASAGAGEWRRAGLYKVAHHGSITGHHEDVWGKMLHPAPVAVLAPWHNGGHVEPEQEDRDRILALAGSAYTTATSRTVKAPKRAPAVERTIRETVGELKSAQPLPGLARFRKKIGTSGAWNVELFDGAADLSTWV